MTSITSFCTPKEQSKIITSQCACGNELRGGWRRWKVYAEESTMIIGPKVHGLSRKESGAGRIEISNREENCVLPISDGFIQGTYQYQLSFRTGMALSLVTAVHSRKGSTSPRAELSITQKVVSQTLLPCGGNSLEMYSVSVFKRTFSNHFLLS